MLDPLQNEKVSLLFADEDKRVCTLFEMYGATQEGFEVCATVHNAQRVLELLRAGLRPQVLVLDVLLPGCDPAELLRNLREFLPHYRPLILLTSVRLPERMMSCLLTLGADYIIFKPYHFHTVFDMAYTLAREPAAAKPYETHYYIHDLLEQLGVGAHCRGGQYLEQMVNFLLASDTACTAEELYGVVARHESISTAAVSSAVYRLGTIAFRHGGAAYEKLCRLAGMPATERLANNALIRSFAEYVRLAPH